MDSSGRLPPGLTQNWAKLKKDLVAKVDRAVGSQGDAETKKKIKKGLKLLFKGFDAGLKKQMVRASTAEDDAVAKKALVKIGITCKKYRKSTKEAVAGILRDADPGMDNLPGITKAFGAKINGTLKAIDKAAVATLGAMP